MVDFLKLLETPAVVSARATAQVGRAVARTAASANPAPGIQELGAGLQRGWSESQLAGLSAQMRLPQLSSLRPVQEYFARVPSKGILGAAGVTKAQFYGTKNPRTIAALNVMGVGEGGVIAAEAARGAEYVGAETIPRLAEATAPVGAAAEEAARANAQATESLTARAGRLFRDLGPATSRALQVGIKYGGSALLVGAGVGYGVEIAGTGVGAGLAATGEGVGAGLSAAFGLGAPGVGGLPGLPAPSGGAPVPSTSSSLTSSPLFLLLLLGGGLLVAYEVTKHR